MTQKHLKARFSPSVNHIGRGRGRRLYSWRRRGHAEVERVRLGDARAPCSYRCAEKRAGERLGHDLAAHLCKRVRDLDHRSSSLNRDGDDADGDVRGH